MSDDPSETEVKNRLKILIVGKYIATLVIFFVVSAYGAWIFAREEMLSLAKGTLPEKYYLYFFTDLQRPEEFGKCDGRTGGVYDVVIETSAHEVKFTATDPEGRTVTPDTPREKYEVWIENGAHWAMSVGGGNGPSTRRAYSTHLKQGDYIIRFIPNEEYNDIRFNMDVKLPNRCIRLVNNSSLSEISRNAFVLNLYEINAPPRDPLPQPPPFYTTTRVDDSKMILTTEGYSFEYPSYVLIRDRYQTYLEWPGASSTISTLSGSRILHIMPHVEFGILHPFQGDNLFDDFLLFADGHRSSISTSIPTLNDISFKRNKNGIEYAEFYVTQTTTAYEENGGTKKESGRVGPNVIFATPGGAYLKFKSGENSKVQKEGEDEVSEMSMANIPKWDFLADFQSIIDSVSIKAPESPPRPGGVGAMFSAGGTFPSAVEVLADSPAEEAGLQQNDYVLTIDGWSTKGAEMEEIVLRLRGDPGTVVELVVRAPDYNGITIYEDENAVMPERKLTITRRDLSKYQSSLRQRIEMDAQK